VSHCEALFAEAISCFLKIVSLRNARNDGYKIIRNEYKMQTARQRAFKIMKAAF
jgi:hypothetical protein